MGYRGSRAAAAPADDPQILATHSSGADHPTRIDLDQFHRFTEGSRGKTPPVAPERRRLVPYGGTAAFDISGPRSNPEQDANIRARAALPNARPDQTNAAQFRSALFGLGTLMRTALNLTPQAAA
jgi:hypothetical protein